MEANRQAAESLKKERWFIVFSITVGLLTVLVASAILAVVHLKREDTRIHAEVDLRLTAIRSAGDPMTAEDLAKCYPDPPAQRDAAILLKPALQALSVPDGLTNVPLFDDTELPVSSPLGESMRAAIRNLLAQNRSALRSIPWKRLGSAWIGAGFTNGLAHVRHAPLSAMLKLARLLCLQAVLGAEKGEPDKAMQLVKQALAIGDTMRGGLPIHHFAKGAVEQLACRTVERILNRTQPSAAVLSSFSGALTITNTGAIRGILLEERCLGLSLVKDLQSKVRTLTASSHSPIGRLFKSYQARLLYHEGDLLQYLNWSRQCLAALDLPLSNSIVILKRIEKHESQKRHASFLSAFENDRSSLLSLLCELQVTQFLLPEARVAAEERATITALAVERWRLHHHDQLPDSLGQLVPQYLSAIPIDPFNSRPLHYRKRSGGFIVYSVGPDFTDDGGKRQLPGKPDAEHRDIVFAVERKIYQ